MWTIHNRNGKRAITRKPDPGSDECAHDVHADLAASKLVRRCIFDLGDGVYVDAGFICEVLLCPIKQHSRGTHLTPGNRAQAASRIDTSRASLNDFCDEQIHPTPTPNRQG